MTKCDGFDAIFEGAKASNFTGSKWRALPFVIEGRKQQQRVKQLAVPKRIPIRKSARPGSDFDRQAFLHASGSLL